MATTNDTVETFDGGQIQNPGFRIRPVSIENSTHVELYMQTFEQVPGQSGRWVSRPMDRWHLLATLHDSWIVMYPVFTNPHAQRYLRSRHGSLTSIVLVDAEGREPAQSADDAVGQIETAKPYRMFNDCHEGLGFISELDLFWKGIVASLPEVHTLVIDGGEAPALADGRLTVDEEDIAALRRRFVRVKRIARDRSLAAGRMILRNELLARIDGQRFAPIEPAEARMVELVRGTATRGVARRARHTAVDAVREALPTLAQEQPREILQLHAEIERVTLARMVERFQEMLQTPNVNEPRWQRFFQDNIFILKMALACPVRLVHPQFHAQGSTLPGSGAQIGDFLFAEHGTALAIVEIKKPDTELVLGTQYRPGVHGPSRELAGAITQVLGQQSSMRIEWQRHFTQNEQLRGSGADVIRCVVLAGRMPVDPAERRSFEIFRSACKDVMVITYDELLAKLQLLLDHLTPAPVAPGENDVPF